MRNPVKAAMRAITEQYVQESIKCFEYHLFRNTRHMVCCATMHCGYTVVGESACSDAEKFDIKLGEKYAREDAERKVAELLAYEQLLKLSMGATYEH